MTWNSDMSKAPRDGTVVLLADTGIGGFSSRVFCGCWTNDEWTFVEDEDDLRNGPNSYVRGFGPTHWMPLPEPPEQDNE